MPNKAAQNPQIKRASIIGSAVVSSLTDLKPDPCNPRRHKPAQIRAIARSIEAFGFNAPILVDRDRQIVAGHGRFEAARLLHLEKVPVVSLDHLTREQARAYMIADNALTDRSSWNDHELAMQLKALTELALDFEIEAVGFEMPELDLRIQSLNQLADDENEQTPSLAAGGASSRPGDLWIIGDHRLLCASAIEAESYRTLLNTLKAAAVFTDPPYNVKIDGHVCGAGALKHREFAMGAGEMSVAQFTRFLQTFLSSAKAHSADGAIIFVCMDWRHLRELLDAGASNALDLINFCVWVKTNGGMGSLYRSRHELIFVFRNGQTAHVNNVQLGRFGRNRTNVWHYEGSNSFGTAKARSARQLHPTLKPVSLVADALLDVTKRGDIVLDPFVGSGTTILAAERVGRRCFGIELDPLYVDAAITRWQQRTGYQARLSTGETFTEITEIRRS